MIQISGGEHPDMDGNVALATQVAGHRDDIVASGAYGQGSAPPPIQVRREVNESGIDTPCSPHRLASCDLWRLQADAEHVCSKQPPDTGAGLQDTVIWVASPLTRDTVVSILPLIQRPPADTQKVWGCGDLRAGLSFSTTSTEAEPLQLLTPVTETL